MVFRRRFLRTTKVRYGLKPASPCLTNRAALCMSTIPKPLVVGSMKPAFFVWKRIASTQRSFVITSYSIHYTKLYDLASQANLRERFEDLQEAFGLEALPERIECFDISHTRGERTVAACVVFDSSGPVKSDYRRFNIEGIAPGDDYAAIEQALTRRYRRIKEGEGAQAARAAPLPVRELEGRRCGQSYNFV